MARPAFGTPDTKDLQFAAHRQGSAISPPQSGGKAPSESTASIRSPCRMGSVSLNVVASNRVGVSPLAAFAIRSRSDS